MLYDGTGGRATALWMPDQVVDLAAGDLFKVGVRIQTDDTGRGRIRVAGVVEPWGHARTVKVAPEALLRSWVEDKRLRPWAGQERDRGVEALPRRL